MVTAPVLVVTMPVDEISLICPEGGDQSKVMYSFKETDFNFPRELLLLVSEVT
jgi:hypothetical protein